MPIRTIHQFFKLESAAGILLIGVLGLTLILTNSSWVGWHQSIIDIPVQVRIGALDIDKPLLLWINDFLMALFFLLLGLEIKREVLSGELSCPAQITLPVLTAIGGILAPIAVYYYFNHGQAEAINGWAIPTPTDVALALGVVAMLGSRVPTSLKVFLVALAIVDDVLAVTLIAVFYSGNLSMTSVFLALGGVFVLAILNWRHVTSLTAYLLVGLFIWVCVLKSGIHATLAGCVLGFCIPLEGKTEQDASPLRHLEHSLHPWIAFGVLPLFIFANASIPLNWTALQQINNPVSLGAGLGLFLGKQIGVFGLGFLAIKLKLAQLPRGANWLQFYGIATLTGIGFTMSLFIAALAFPNGPYLIYAQQGVLLGSGLSALFGISALLISGKQQ